MISTPIIYFTQLSEIMHFSIPDTQEIKDESGSTYVVYNIHVNGVFHCTVRYRQLHNLHEQLKKQYGASALPFFPSKKLFSLTPAQIEERRIQLEKYVQFVSQDSRIVNSEAFNGFLLSAQQETQEQDSQEVTLDVYLMNGHKISLTIMSNLQTDDVLESVAKSLDLSDDYVYYFALFLVRRDSDGQVTIVRKMQDFESPYISSQSVAGTHRIVLRRNYWDSGCDEELMEDRIALNLLYVQTVADIERGWILSTKEIQRQLATLQAKGSKREYLQLAKTLKYYGYIQFKPCTCDYPSAGLNTLVSAGNYELNFRVHVNKDQVKEFCFKVTRMKRWRITTSINQQTNGEANAKKGELQLELAFEYLIAKDKLQWVNVLSEQAILMSLCLQGMVEELMMKKNGTRMKRPHDKPRKGSWSYMKRDGSSHQISVSRSTSSDAILESTQKENNESSIKKLSEKLSAVSLTGKSSVRTGHLPKGLVENDAFEGIGDDDL